MNLILQLGDHFDRIRELLGVEFQFSVARLPIVVQLQLTVVESITTNFAAES